MSLKCLCHVRQVLRWVSRAARDCGCQWPPPDHAQRTAVAAGNRCLQVWAVLASCLVASCCSCCGWARCMLATCSPHQLPPRLHSTLVCCMHRCVAPVPTQMLLCAGCSPGYGSYEPAASSSAHRRNPSLPVRPPSGCAWYTRGGPAACRCQPCASGTWSQGGRLSLAKCEPTQGQTVAVSLVLHGACGSHVGSDDVLRAQLRSSLLTYPGVSKAAVTVTVLEATDGNFNSKVWPPVLPGRAGNTHLTVARLLLAIGQHASLQQCAWSMWGTPTPVHCLHICVETTQYVSSWTSGTACCLHLLASTAAVCTVTACRVLSGTRCPAMGGCALPLHLAANPSPPPLLPPHATVFWGNLQRTRMSLPSEDHPGGHAWDCRPAGF